MTKWLVKIVVFGIINGLNRRRRPRRELMDDIKEWCRADAQTLSIIAQDRSEWRRVVMDALHGHQRTQDHGINKKKKKKKKKEKKKNINEFHRSIHLSFC